MVEWSDQEVNDMINTVMEKSAVDSEFRKLALENPNEAILQVSGKQVPSGIKIKMVENEPGVDRTLVLPDMQGEEISDAELEFVAGGCSLSQYCR